MTSVAPSLYTASASAHAVPVSPCGLAPAEGVPEDVAAHCLRSAGVPLRVVRLLRESLSSHRSRL